MDNALTRMGRDKRRMAEMSEDLEPGPRFNWGQGIRDAEMREPAAQDVADFEDEPLAGRRFDPAADPDEDPDQIAANRAYHRNALTRPDAKMMRLGGPSPERENADVVNGPNGPLYRDPDAPPVGNEFGSAMMRRASDPNDQLFHVWDRMTVGLENNQPGAERAYGATQDALHRYYRLRSQR